MRPAAFVSAMFAAVALQAAPATAQSWSLAKPGTQFQRIEDRNTFVEVMSSGALTRFGIQLRVGPDGGILGRAFGRDISGQWEWRDGYFCRDMAWGATQLDSNCQVVRVAGNLVRFESDRGQGRHADLVLEGPSS